MKREGSFEGVNMTWSVSNFKSPLRSLTEEYGNLCEVESVPCTIFFDFEISTGMSFGTEKKVCPYMISRES